MQGSLDDLSFYSSVFGDIVRRKGGASKEKIRKSPAFARLREHQAEFAGCAAAGKLLRGGLNIFTRPMASHKLVGQVMRLMNQLKNLDGSAARGETQSLEGAGDARGQGAAEGLCL